MFCFQCEQAAHGEGCTKVGVCGKSHETAELHDVLIYTVKGLAQVALEGRKVGVKDSEIDRFAVEAMFSTLTNTDYDNDRFVKFIKQAVSYREALKKKVGAAGGWSDYTSGAAAYMPSETMEALIAEGEKFGPEASQDDPDVRSLKETLTYGIKGISAYTDHAFILGKKDDSIFDFVYEGLAATLNKDLGINDLLGLVLKCGETNLRAMELLDEANTGTYGNPVPVSVPLGAKKGKALLVSGHDLKDLEIILKQTQGKGINVYTHGEMLPCHGYPELKKYEHLYGNYGTAWQRQKKEFSDFPGAIVMTTNCIQKPQAAYQDNIFTTGVVGWPGTPHIADKDFTPAVNKALEMPGFDMDTDNGVVMAGFGHNAVLSVADKVIEGVKNKDIRHFFLVGGCDGAKPGRSYYTEFVEKVPQDCIVMTLACGKYRFFDKNLGSIGGIPRLLDIGQCNDSYSAIKIATGLANAFDCGVNDLPLSMIISWYEQKAVAILLTLLHLGIRDIRLGPSLPAFISPNVLNVLVEKFNIMPISTPDEDLKAILG